MLASSFISFTYLCIFEVSCFYELLPVYSRHYIFNVAIPIYVKQISFSECVLLQDCSETY